MTPPAEPRRLRILHVISGLDLGGAETLLFRLVTRPSDKAEHEVVSLGGRGWYSGPLEDHGIQVHHLSLGSAGSWLPNLLRLRRIIRNGRPDVVQSWLYVSNVLAGLLARPAGIPVVWGIHASTLEHVSRFSRLCARVGGRGSRWLTDFVVNCSARSAELHRRLGYAAAPGAVVHNGYDPEAFFPDEQARVRKRGQLGLAPDSFVIGTIGRWHPQKDIPNLLAATRILHERGVPVRCLLIGAGLEETNPDFMATVRSAGCEQLVSALGARSDVADLGRALDVHVLASSGSEAFPNVIAETMLSGTPNAVTDVGDSALMVERSGWVVRPSDSVALADAIEQAFREWADHPHEWARRRAAARLSIVDRFTFDRMADAYEEIWESVCAAMKLEGP